jgi:hypothetical protein
VGKDAGKDAAAIVRAEAAPSIDPLVALRISIARPFETREACGKTVDDWLPARARKGF